MPFCAGHSKAQTIPDEGESFVITVANSEYLPLFVMDMKFITALIHNVFRVFQ